MSKLTIIDVAELWEDLAQTDANTSQLLANIDDMDMAGFQLVHRLVCEGRVSLEQLNQNIAQTMRLMGCQKSLSSLLQAQLIKQRTEKSAQEIMQIQQTSSSDELSSNDKLEPSNLELTDLLVPDLTTDEYNGEASQIEEIETQEEYNEAQVIEEPVDVDTQGECCEESMISESAEIEPITEEDVQTTIETLASDEANESVVDSAMIDVAETEKIIISEDDPSNSPELTNAPPEMVTIELPTTQVIHDLSWKDIRKTIMTMNLAVAQIDLSMTEGEFSVDTLIDSFSFMNGEIDRINSVLQGDHVDIDQIRTMLTQQSIDLTEKADASIVAFQFYDKLSQRLHHVSQSLSALTDIISCGDCIVDEGNWDKFMDSMAKYACMREESELFELIFERGYSATTAVEMIKEILSERMETAREKHKNDAPNFEDDIELF